MGQSNRRIFIKKTIVGMAAGAIAPGILAGERNDPAFIAAYTPEMPELGLASYTTRELSLDDTIGIARRVGLIHLGLKSFHLPLDATEDECKAAAEKIKSAGIDFYSAGVIYMNTREEVDQAFSYARACGIRIIVGVSAHDLLGYTEEMARRYDVSVAIHNHGPGDQVYPTVPGIYEMIRDMDRRMGICMDIGHIVRLGRDPVAELNQCFDRILDMHIKDEDKRAAESKPIEIGRGVIDIPAFLRAVKQLKYNGIMAFEFEKDPQDPLPGLAESVGYVRGVWDAI
jgi:sugar phosphate isomerase/epimerase